jgi:phosphoglycerate kinase
MKPNFLQMKDLDLTNQHVIIREDLNVPMDDQGNITNFARIERALPTLREAIKQNAAVLVLSHLGRPKEEKFDARYSLEKVAAALSEKLGQSVEVVNDWLNGTRIKPGQLALAENVRFYPGEMQNDPELAKRMAKQCDIFVMDAFATAHRAQASTVGIAEYAPVACAGPLLVEEVTAISKALEHPKPPVVAIVGGSKVSTKIQLLRALLKQVDQLIVGGGIANTFLVAAGYSVGQSLYEAEWVNEAKELMKEAELSNTLIPLPVDVAVAKSFSANEKATIRDVSEIQNDDMILDVGPKTSARYTPILKNAGTIIWNGPVGVFEFAEFRNGTAALAKAIAESHAYSLAGGGDTLSALEMFNISDRISYASTGGGAFLEYIQAGDLPGISILTKRSQTHNKKGSK